jgi:TonB family protein
MALRLAGLGALHASHGIMNRILGPDRSGIMLAVISCLSMSAVDCTASRSGIRSAPLDTTAGASESSSAPSSGTSSLAYNDPSSSNAIDSGTPSDAAHAGTQKAPCNAATCSPVYTGPVDEYVSILDSGIPRFPQYPPLALREGVEGMVRVRVLVGTDGSLCDAEVVDGPELLWEPAIQAAREANMAPAMKDGCPVPIWVVIPFQFTLPPDARAKTARKSAR